MRLSHAPQLFLPHPPYIRRLDGEYYSPVEMTPQTRAEFQIEYGNPTRNPARIIGFLRLLLRVQRVYKTTEPTEQNKRRTVRAYFMFASETYSNPVIH
jgi:hypothetical protein